MIIWEEVVGIAIEDRLSKCKTGLQKCTTKRILVWFLCYRNYLKLGSL